MRNKKNQNNMCDVTRDLQTSSLLKTATFSQNTPSLEREVLYARP